jgi:acetylornithine deacetylase/succinyl-diaminopimelate desuccinylase-like protein
MSETAEPSPQENGNDALDELVGHLPAYREKLQSLREILLANAVMFGEIAAPTGQEEQRIRFLSDRFVEAGLQSISVDEEGNGTAIVQGRKGKNNILVIAHADTPFDATVNHAMAVEQHRITGPGIGDNSLGLAMVASLPTLLEKLDIQFDDNLILIGDTKSLGRGDLKGLRFFLDHNKLPVRAGVCVQGVHLGRLSYTSLGMMRAVITVEVPEAYDWRKFGPTGAIVNINKVITGILGIPLPREPKTNIVLGSVQAGTAYNTAPMRAVLRFEVRSEAAGMVGKIHEQIREIIDEIASDTETSIKLEVIARRKPGGIDYSGPFVKAVRKVMHKLEITPKLAPSTGELSALIDKDIPGVTLGLTNGDNIHEQNESVQIDPIYTGIVQVLGTLQAIDGGFADE